MIFWAPPLFTAWRYSAAVKRRPRELSQVAIARGDGAAFLAALKAFVDRLPIYPQFGESIRDLAVEEGQIRMGIVFLTQPMATNEDGFAKCCC